MGAIAEAYKNLVRSDYEAYCLEANDGNWMPTRVVKYLCGLVQDFMREETGHPYDILCISMPPQHGKSLTITETLPSWFLLRNPKKRVIEISYSEEFAQLFGRRNKDKMVRLGGWFGVQLAGAPNSATEFETTLGGGMISRGIHSGVTGRACDLMIIDDPIKTRQEALSPATRSSIYQEWLYSFRTRLSAGAKVIVIQTRWHEDDLVGRLTQEERNICAINIPCEAEKDDPLGRSRGEALAPELKKGDEWLRQFKEDQLQQEGSQVWSALYQGHPASEEGNLFKRGWWRFYDEPPQLVHSVISVDAAFKDGNANDYVAIQAWGKRGADLYLLDAIKEHLSFPETVRAIKAMYARMNPKPAAILIEDKANGPAIIQTLRRELSGVIGVNPQGGKEARASAVTGYLEAGNVYLPRFSAFTGDLIEECAAFPNGKHDDQVDAMTQALTRLGSFQSTAQVIDTDPDPFGLKRDARQPNTLCRERNVVL